MHIKAMIVSCDGREFIYTDVEIDAPQADINTAIKDHSLGDCVKVVLIP